jgi:CrcB protein
MTLRAVFGLALGSLLGGFARYGVSAAFFRLRGTSFPPGTLWVNLAGCFALGLFSAWADGNARISPETRLFFMTGFCGAFTTFSTFLMETSALVRGGSPGRAFLYVAVSLVAGFGFYRLGEWGGASAR